MKFFKATDGRYYPTNDILSIGKEREVETRSGSSKVHALDMRDSSTAEIWWHQLEDIIREDATAFPALPGTYVLHSLEAPDDDVWKTPVIAWRVNAGATEVEPITVDGVNDGGAWTTVLMPDGSVARAGDQMWRSLEQWEAQMRAELSQSSEMTTEQG